MILNWIRHRIAQRRRKIFRYSDGYRIRAVDPVEVAIAIAEHKTFLPEHLQGAVDGDRESQRVVAATACAVFDVDAFEDGLGMTVAERIELMLAFDLYLLTVKKNIAVSQTPPNSTESTSLPSVESTTSSTSASGSIGTEPLPDAQNTTASAS